MKEPAVTTLELRELRKLKQERAMFKEHATINSRLRAEEASLHLATKAKLASALAREQTLERELFDWKRRFDLLLARTPEAKA